MTREHGRDGGAQSRVLLRRIRETLARSSEGAGQDGAGADGGRTQQRLTQIVRLIATNMVAEVCSIYLLKRDGALEMVATEGLKADAVNRARLAIGEGLVGRIARDGVTINTEDAVNASGFQLIPGIGEEVYSSFLGVAIRRLGRTLGVLVVQNRAARRYGPDEVDALELIATVIAEMTEAGALAELKLEDPRRTGPVMIQGAAAAEGVALGRVAFHEPKFVLARPIAEDVEVERTRLRAAMAEMRVEIDRLISGEAHVDGFGGAERAAGLRAPGEHRDVLEAYRMVAHDHGWLRRLEDAVNSGLAAEAAVEKVQTETRARLERTNDGYLRERLSDFDDLANRLLRSLLGVKPPAPEDLPSDAVLLARNLGPGELLEYGRGRLKGVALEEGSAGSHAAIVARALDIPLATGLKGLIDLANADDPIIVDGDVGRVLLRPESSVANAYREKLSLKAQEAAQFREIRDKPAQTRDGVRVALHMNAGLLTDLPSLGESGAEGVGLYRTELQYLVRSRPPRRDAQTRLYTRVLEAAGSTPVVFRTLDMGGDKQLPFLKGAAEENPALGWRAVRIALDRPLLFRTQLQALVRAGAGRPLFVMFPMIAAASEFFAARALLIAELERAEREARTPPLTVKIGAMLETPALAFAPRGFFETADFISVGGNDLRQFFFAADRGNQRVRTRFDSLDPSFLGLLRMIVARCADAGTPLSFCGEMASRPLDALALAAIGFRTLSMRPAGIGPVKRALRAARLSDVVAAIEEAEAMEAASARPLLARRCAEAGVPV
ncbi:MAG: phosphoenolpyruvate--protein phosphotransferase [Pseudomonadota bacterium]